MTSTTDAEPRGTTAPSPVASRGANRAGRASRCRRAYTILFALIVLTALATWIIPAGQLRARRGRLADPRHLRGGRVDPAADRRRLAQGADQRPLRHRGPGHRQRRRVQQRRAVRRHRRRPVHPRHRRLHRHHDEDRRHPGRHRPAWSRRLRGHERWMIPILMTVFAIGGTTFGMAEESLAFYVLIITVMIAAGYDALVGRAGDPARRRHRRARLDGQPVRHRHRLRLRRRLAQRRPRAPARHPRRRPGRSASGSCCATPSGCSAIRRRRSSTT